MREERFITETEAAAMEYMDNGVPSKTSEPCYSFRFQSTVDADRHDHGGPAMVQPKSAEL